MNEKVEVSVEELKNLYRALNASQRALDVVKAAMLDMGFNELANVLSKNDVYFKLGYLRKILKYEDELMCDEYSD